MNDRNTFSIVQPGFTEEEKRAGTSNSNAASATTTTASGQRPNKKQREKNKPVYLKDYQRNALIAGAGGDNDYSEDPDVGNGAGEGFNDLYFRTPAQEARDLQAETRAAFFGAGGSGDDDEEDGDEGGLLVKRESNDADEAEDEGARYRRFLLENVGEEEVEKALKLRRESQRMANGKHGKKENSSGDGDETAENTQEVG